MPLGDESSYITCSPKITGKGFAICKLLMKFRVMKIDLNGVHFWKYYD